MTAVTGKDVKKEEYSISDSIASWYTHSGNQSGCSLELELELELEIVLHEDPTIPLLGIYLKDSPTYHMESCSIVFKAVLFIITRSRKQPTCSSTEERIHKMS